MMNKLIKLLAISLIAVFAAVSCSPDLSLSSFDWESANTVNNPNNINATPGEFLPELENADTKKKNPRFTIKFPNQADVLRLSKDKIQASLEEFLSFHNFAQPADPEWEEKSNVSVLLAAIPYKYIKMSGTSITVELNKDFGSDIDYSDLIIKFDGKKYTHSRGIMMDVDNDGVAGAGYFDDYYIGASLDDSLLKKESFVRPGHRLWTITLKGTPGFTLPTINEIENFEIASISLEGIVLGQNNDQAFREVGELFASGFKLQKYDGKVWSDVQSGSYDHSKGENAIIISGKITANHGDIFRTYWSGPRNLTVNKEYFEVRQRVVVLGGQNEPNNLRDQLARTTAAAKAVVNYNSNIYQEITTAPMMEVITWDVNGRNALLKFTFPIQGSILSRRGLNEYGLKDFQGDNAIFKIVRPLNDASGPLTEENIFNGTYRTVKVDKVLFQKEAYGYDIVNYDEFNVIYITIDAGSAAGTNFDELRLLINDKFAYRGDNPERRFGDRTNFTIGNYRLYTPSTGGFPAPTNPFVGEDAAVNNIKTDGTWNISSLSDSSTGRKFTFTPTTGKYYEIQWDELNNGTGQYSKGIQVSAEGLSLGAGFFTNQTGGYTNPRSFTAVSEETVTLTVRTNSGTKAGSFAIRVTETTPKVFDNDTYTITAGGWKEFTFKERSLGMNITLTGTTAGNIYIVEWNDLDGSGKYSKDIYVNINNGGANFSGNEGYFTKRQFIASGTDVTIAVTSVDGDKAGNFELRVTEKTHSDNNKLDYDPKNPVLIETELTPYYKGRDIEFVAVAGDTYKIELFDKTSKRYTGTINTAQLFNSSGAELEPLFYVSDTPHEWTASTSGRVTLTVLPRIENGVYYYGTFGVRIAELREQDWDTDVLIDQNSVTNGSWLPQVNLTELSLGKKYSFNASANTQYRIEWQDNGTGGNTKDVVVSIIGAGVNEEKNDDTFYEFTANGAGGTVSITVEPKIPGSPAGSFRLRVCERAWKADVSINDNSIVNGVWQTATLGAFSLGQRYTFNAVDGRNYRIIWESGDPGYTKEVLVKVNGAGQDITDSEAKYLAFTAEGSGIVTIEVTPKTIGSTAADFRLRVHSTDTLTVGNASAWQNGTMTANSNGVEYSFSVTSGNKYLLGFNSSAGTQTASANIEVFNALGISVLQLTGANGWNGSTVASSFTASANESYTLRVTPVNAGSSGSFQVKVTDISSISVMNFVSNSCSVEGNTTNGTDEFTYYMNVTSGKTYTFQSDNSADVKGISYSYFYFTGGSSSPVSNNFSETEGSFDAIGTGVVVIVFSATNNTESGDYNFTVTEN